MNTRVEAIPQACSKVELGSLGLLLYTNLSIVAMEPHFPVIWRSWRLIAEKVWLGIMLTKIVSDFLFLILDDYVSGDEGVCNLFGE